MVKTISQLIRKKRKALSLTIEQLAEKSNVSISLISRIERGDVANISINKLYDIASALDLELSDFFSRQQFSDIPTLELLQYFSTLTDEKREELSKSILRIIQL
ncbi:helix-turn-helix domain-containing protein [Dellaglioa sp. P0083]|uniref:helix-turn-helix domain-containing protein n=1 Tax=Dellaglioa kimchii TaxID=3344667 RepID=UPI0038D4FCEA